VGSGRFIKSQLTLWAVDLKDFLSNNPGEMLPHHTRLSKRTDSQVNYWIIAQETRQKSAIDHVSPGKSRRKRDHSPQFLNMSFYSVRTDSLVWHGRVIPRNALTF
jgi:hypothetical protein